MVTERQGGAQRRPTETRPTLPMSNSLRRRLLLLLLPLSPPRLSPAGCADAATANVLLLDSCWSNCGIRCAVFLLLGCLHRHVLVLVGAKKNPRSMLWRWTKAEK